MKIIRDVTNTTEHIAVFLILYGRNFLDTTQYINTGMAGIHKKEYTTSAIESIISKAIMLRHPPPLLFDVLLIVFPLFSLVFPFLVSV